VLPAGKVKEESVVVLDANSLGGGTEDVAKGGTVGNGSLLRRPQAWELMLTGITATILAISFAVRASQLPKTPYCGFKAITGKPCPGCGLTRSFCAISHGRLGKAWDYNPFGFPLYVLTAFFMVFPWVNRLWMGLGRGIQRTRIAVWLPVTLVAAMWIYGTVRLLTGGGPPAH